MYKPNALLTALFVLGLATASAAQTLPSYLPTDGLVGWWPFNGNANDESGNGNHGTVNGATLTLDRNSDPNTAYYFNGTQYIQINPFNALIGSNPFSVSFWTLATGGGWMIACGQINDGMGFDAGNNNNGIENFHAHIYKFDHTSSLTSISNTQWINISIVFKDNRMKVYKNGIMSINDTVDYVVANLEPGILQFGKQLIFNEYFTGSLDDIAIYNRALTPEEITALYTATPSNAGGGNTASTNVPQGISYQAVARNPQGQPLTNTALQVKFTLLSDSLTGTAEYAELHSLTTNDLGLFTTAFGTGTPLSGTFANINWAGGNKFVKIEADQGSGFIEMGTQQMLSVPYALQAKKTMLLENNALPVYSNNTSALAGGLQAGQMYRTATGVLMVVY